MQSLIPAAIYVAAAIVGVRLLGIRRMLKWADRPITATDQKATESTEYAATEYTEYTATEYTECTATEYTECTATEYTEYTATEYTECTATEYTECTATEYPECTATEYTELVLAVDRAGRRISGGTCLARSLALTRMLRARGIPAETKIGVKTEDGFHAHAWVEVAGVPITRPEGRLLPSPAR